MEENNKNNVVTDEKALKESTPNNNEVKEDIKPLDLNVDIYEMDLSFNNDDFQDNVEIARKPADEMRRKLELTTRILGWIGGIMGLGGFIMSVQANNIVRYTGIGLILAALLGMLIFAFAKGKKPKEIYRDYFNSMMAYTNCYIYKDSGIKNLSVNPTEKAELGLFASDRVYKRVLGVTSRNLIKGSYLNHPITTVDCCLAGVDEKSKTFRYFLGKYISSENEYKFDGRVIVNICMNDDEPLEIADDINDLVQVEHDKQLTVWATPGLDYKKILTADVMRVINRFDVAKAKHLLNVNLVFWGGHTAAYLSFDDELMNVDIKKEFDKEPTHLEKRALDDVLDILAIMMKPRNVICHKTASTKQDDEAIVEAVEEIKEVVEETKSQDKGE